MKSRFRKQIINIFFICFNQIGIIERAERKGKLLF